MRLGLLGDIHGNAPALAAVLAAAERSGVDALCLTGDFVGYYYEPETVLSMLSAWQRHAVRGNHEDLLVESMSDGRAAAAYKRKYGSGVEVATQRLSAAERTYLEQLPRTLRLELDGKTLLLGHGAPWDTDFYMYANVDEKLWDRAVESSPDYLVLGHTHHRFAKRIRDTLVVNPGSVGQPRDRQPGAAWAVLDTETGEVAHHTEEYDIDTVVAQARAKDPQLPYLAEVLTRR
jgi:putative phosphoesterase